MKKLITTLLLAFVALAAVAQVKKVTPKTHVFYDTVKVVKTRVDYSPDTIPVYFKEIIVKEGIVSEAWQPGFVIWQTYIKNTDQQVSGLYNSTYPAGVTWINRNGPEFIKNDYHYSEFLDDKFLYTDLKPVKNRVIYCIKRDPIHQ